MERFRILQRLRPATVAVLAVLCGAGLIRPTQAQVTLTDLGKLTPRGISFDGTRIVGTYYPDPNASTQPRAFLWTLAGGVQSVPELPDSKGSEAYGISGDGSTIVGYCNILGRNATSTNQYRVERAFKWSAKDGALAILPPGPPVYNGELNTARSVNFDGSVVLGVYDNVSGDGYGNGFVQTLNDGLKVIESAQRMRFNSLSWDGTVAVGNIERAIRWTATTGIQELWGGG